MAQTLRPLADRVLVKPKAREDMTKSGIVLPDTVKEKPQEGSVIAVGTGKVLEDGSKVPMEIKVGDSKLLVKATSFDRSKVPFGLMSAYTNHSAITEIAVKEEK